MEFTYTGTKNGRKIQGNLTTQSKEDALASLNRQGIHILVLKETSTKKKKYFRSKVKSKDLVIFTRQLSTMISAGVPLTRAFNTLQNQTQNKYFKSVIQGIAKDIEGGMSLAEALGKYPNTFNEIYVNMVAAGESGGILDDILKRLATQLEKNERIKKKIKSATTYPKVVFGIAVLAFVVVMNLIVPKIGAMLYELNPDAQLPLLTRIMLAISDFTKQYAIVLIILSVIIILFVRKYINSPKGKYKYHSFLLKVPVIKLVISKVAIARFARTFSSLMSAGVTINQSIKVTAGSMGNKVLEKELLDATKEVEAGKQLSECIAKSKYFPAIVSQMLAIGEETGETNVVLVKIADFYEEEVDATIESLSSLLEPLMIVFLGGLVGLVAASVMGPLTSLSGSI